MGGLVIVGGIAVFIVAMVILYFVPLGLWVAALSAEAPVSMFALIGMRLRKVPPASIVMPRISAVKAGIPLTISQLEAHYLAGGHVGNVVSALISAEKARIGLTFDRAAAIDLAGRNVLEAVQMSVNPKVISSPKIAAVAKDGIGVTVITRVTVRANIDRLVGGAGEETVLARIGEGIVSTIGASNTYADVLENPDRISKNVLAKGLDAGTAFEILSIDIADVDVGSNIGAKLQAEQAEANKQIAQAQAEGRRASAVAAEQENRARVEEMRSRLIEAEAQIPLAVAEALRAGNLGVMDYYRMNNVQADTRMRETIAKVDQPDLGDSGPRK
jgi:uncharacterized protein YqfA (UPF0365 family)